ncbi:MAG: hypothetical protein ABR542_07215 [Desulfonatronovibrio sp.]|nr:hypothetical protein [Desulfovibrionales bacterium]
MQIKTYRGKSYSSLIRQIKNELGSDAVILSSDSINTNGKKCYEVVAALENNTEDKTPNPDNNIIPTQKNIPDNMEWRMEWENFKNSFYKIIKNNVSGPNITKRQKQILEYLEKQGVNPEVIMDLWSSLSENIQLPTLKVLGDLVPTATWEKCLSKARAHAFMGPSGVGKTTTVLRIALEARRQNPNWKICLVNTDTQHAGGRLYLKHYASLSGLNYLEMKTAADWQDLAAKKHLYDLILLDTPGFGDDSMSITRDIEDLLGIHTHLVLSPVYGSSQIDHYLSENRTQSIKSIIWTKIDEACSYGVLLNTSWKSGLPVSYLSFGKGLRDSSSSATQENLWMLIFKKKIPERNVAAN